jgi:hypothetical protein
LRLVRAVDGDRAGGDLVDPRDGPDQFRAAGAHDAGDPEDLALVDAEGDVREGAVGRGEPVNLDDFPGTRHSVVREHALEAAADHVFDQLVDRHLGGVVGGDPLAVAEDDDAVADPRDLLESVTDVDERHAFPAERVDALEQVVGLFRSQRCGGLVQEE